MHDAIRTMLDRYACQTREDHVNALREILQEIALLGLWRSKFFEQAAFYGGTALRILYGLDRYSEEMDFSLLRHDSAFSLDRYGEALKRELRSFGFRVEFATPQKPRSSAIASAFLKANTVKHLIEIETPDGLIEGLHPAKVLKIKLEVDTDPPGGFESEMQYVLQPFAFAVRAYSLPDLFAGKLHAVLCRRWKSRVKGRDWYDLAWYAARHPAVRIGHLESRMTQSGDHTGDDPLTLDRLRTELVRAVDELDVEKGRREVAPFVRDRRSLDIWSPDFFRQIVTRITAL